MVNQANLEVHNASYLWLSILLFSIANLELELKKFRNQFEETTDAHEKERKNLNNQITDLNRQKEAALREVTLNILLVDQHS